MIGLDTIHRQLRNSHHCLIEDGGVELGMVDTILEWFAELFTEPPSSVLQLVILYAGAILAISGGVKAMLSRLWPSRPKATWRAGCIPTAQNETDMFGHIDAEADSAWRKDRLRWSQGRVMRVNDWYELRFEKPRMLSEIVAKSQGERFPQKIRLRSKSHNADWQTEIEKEVLLGHHDKNTWFRYRFGEHRKIAAIRFEIIEPTLKPINAQGRSPAWAIYDLDFKEYLFFGCLWEHLIK